MFSMEHQEDKPMRRSCCGEMQESHAVTEERAPLFSTPTEQDESQISTGLSTGFIRPSEVEKSTNLIASESVKKDWGVSADALNSLCQDREGNETSMSTNDKETLKSDKKKRRIPVMLTSPNRSSPCEVNKRRLSLQLHSQPDKEVDQCRRRLSNVDLSRSAYQRQPGESTICAQQNQHCTTTQLPTLLEPHETKSPRSPSASRIPVQRSRSTPPPRQRETYQSKHTPNSTITENESDSLNPSMENVTQQSLRQARSCHQEEGGSSHDTCSGRHSQGLKERGRTGQRLNELDRRRASTAGVTQQYSGRPRARRSLSFSAGCRGSTNTPSQGTLSKERARMCAERGGFQGGSAKETTVTGGTRGISTGTPADGLRSLNSELRDQVTRLRAQLDAQKGSIRQVQWQKVLDVRQARQEEQQRLWAALEDLRHKLAQEKTREVEQMREHLNAKAESDLQKLARHKDVEIFKLKQELTSKESMLKRILQDEKKARMGLSSDSHKTKLLDELKALRQEKRDLEESLDSASSAQRAFSDDLRKHSERRESEVSKVKRDMQIEVKGLQSFSSSRYWEVVEFLQVPPNPGSALPDLTRGVGEVGAFQIS